MAQYFWGNELVYQKLKLAIVQSQCIAMKCYDTSYSFSRRARDLNLTIDILCPCPKSDGCLSHEGMATIGTQPDPVDLSLNYHPIWFRSDLKMFMYYVFCGNRSSRVIFIKLALDLDLAKKGRMVHFEGNWMPIFPQPHDGDGFFYTNIFCHPKHRNFGKFTLAKKWGTVDHDDFMTVTSYIQLMKGPEVALHDHDFDRPLQNTLNICLKKAMAKKMSCDFTVCSKGRSYGCHRLMLSSRSMVFQAMLSYQWKEHQEDCLVLKNYSANSVKNFLRILYGQPLSGKLTEKDTFQVIEMMHKYGVEICSSSFDEPIECQYLGESCFSDFVKLLTSNHDGYSTTAIDIYQRTRILQPPKCDLTALYVWSLEQTLNGRIQSGQQEVLFAGFWLDALLAASKVHEPLKFEHLFFNP